MKMPNARKVVERMHPTGAVVTRLPVVRARHLPVVTLHDMHRNLEAFPYQNRSSGLGDWLDVASGDFTAADPGVMTLDASPVDMSTGAMDSGIGMPATLDTSQVVDNSTPIYDARDAYAQGTATAPDVNATDNTVLDARDAYATGAAPDTSVSTDTTSTSTTDTSGQVATTDNTVLDRSDAWAKGLAQPPAAVVTHTPQASSGWENILGGVAAVAAGIASYKKTSLPGGGAIYQRYDPVTGQPVMGGGTMTFGPRASRPGMTGGLSSMFSNPMVLAGVAGVGLMLLLTLGKRRK